MSRLAAFIGCVMIVLSANAAFAADPAPKVGESSPDKVIYDADSAFNFLLTLSGEWTRGGAVDHEHGTPLRSVKFRNSAAGSAVIETFYEGQPNEMITVFHRNGGELLMTHYCALQNAPVMKFVKSDTPGEIKFEFHGGTNFDPAIDPHVHQGKFQVKSGDVIESTFQSFTNGKPPTRPAAPALMQRKPGVKQ